jgi:hypothetical protein
MAMQASNEFVSTLGALARPSGLARLQAHLARTDHQLSKNEESTLQQLIYDELQEDPSLESTRLRVGQTGAGGAAYLPKSRLISVTHPGDLPALAHELGHARSVGDSQNAYGQLQNLSRKLWAVTQFATLPAAIGTAILTKGALRNKILGTLALLSALPALPVLFEEGAATLHAAQKLPSDQPVWKRTLPALGSYAIAAALPPATALITRSIANRL